MKSRILVILPLLFCFSPSWGQEDLSGFGIKVEPAPARASRTTKAEWTSAVCADVQRMETAIAEDARPADRPFLRIGLLFLQQKHCGIDVSAKLAADQQILDGAKEQADRDYRRSMEAATRAAATPPPSATINIQPAQAPSSLPDPAPRVTCTTTRLGGGVSTTNCR